MSTPKTDQLAQKWDEGLLMPSDLLASARELEKENAALRADKERLDWLEKYGATPICSRAAIDAARKETKP